MPSAFDSRFFAFALVAMVIGPVAEAGPWSDLPDAVTRLQLRSDDPAAREVLHDAEETVVAAARDGRLAAVTELMATYQELVLPLADGDIRFDHLAREVAQTLVDEGDRVVQSDPELAYLRWAVAMRYAPTGRAAARVRPLLIPPADAEPGERWFSAADGAEMVWLPPFQSRVGCSDGDRLCRDDEIYFRYISFEGLWVDSHEVTNRRYQDCVKAGWCSPVERTGDEGDVDLAPNLPVVNLTWRQASTFASWTGRRLPSEAEWERAARSSGDRGRFPWGPARDRSLANVWPDTAVSDPFAGVAPVGSFPASPYGLWDVAGNVWEWCADRYTNRLKDLPQDGTPWLGDGHGRVVRGGSWRRTLELARVSTRAWQDDDYRADDLGLRVVTGGAEPDPWRLAEIAGRVWPLPTPDGSPFVGLALDAEDRRYLEKRTLTWLVLEDRYDAALPLAFSVLASGSADPVVKDLVDRVERSIVDLAVRGQPEDLRPLLLAYRDAAAGRPELATRSRRILQQALRSLRATGQQLLEAGDTDAAAERFRLALLVVPDDSLLRRSLDLTLPRPGTVKVWPGDGREMVWIPGGSVRIGASAGDTEAAADEHPARIVEVDGYWIDRREVTNRDYRKCVDAGACSPPHDLVMFDDPNLTEHPVMWVDWYQAREYSRWAGKRLPTESEWERAGRAGGQHRYPWGLVWKVGLCNGLGVEDGDRWGGPAPVASFKDSTWGVFDMIGNAAEWVADLYHRDYRGAPQSGRPWNQLTGGPVELRRVIRGGSYDSPPARLRVSFRDSRPPDTWHRSLGFRCAADPENGR